MRYRPTRTLTAALIAAIALGCEGRTSGLLISGPSSGARVRVFNAVTSATSVDLLIDGQVAASGISFGAASAYVPLSTGSHRLQIRSAQTGTTLLDLTRDFASDGAFSLIPAPGLGGAGALVTTDDLTAVAGQGRVRIVHAAAATQGPVSVYVTAPTVDIGSATPAIPALDFAAASGYVNIAPGTYRVRVTRAGSPADVLLDTGGVIIGSGSVRSLVLTDAPGGGLPTTMSIIPDAN